MINTQELVEISRELEIHEIGFCSIEPDQKEKMLELTDAQSFIVILESYPLVKPKRSQGELKGIISCAAVGIDYHVIVRDKLKKLQEYIEQKFNCTCVSYCDQSPFSDRKIAVQAGLGRIGKNTFLIHPTWGSSVFIGYLAVNMICDEYNSVLQSNPCGSCEKCEKACPSQAIQEETTFESKKCISYLTQAKELDDQEKKLLGISLYGCDICQFICPHNTISMDYSQTPIVPPEYDLVKLLEISNKEFKNTFGKTASGWRGKKTLQRNAQIALDHIKEVE